MNLGCRALGGLVATLGFDTGAMRRAADVPTLAAVDLAEWLVERKVPFRRAHGIVGGLVRDALEGGRPLADLVRASPELGPEAAELLEPGAAATRRRSAGGAGRIAVDTQLERFTRQLEVLARQLDGR